MLTHFFFSCSSSPSCTLLLLLIFFSRFPPREKKRKMSFNFEQAKNRSKMARTSAVGLVPTNPTQLLKFMAKSGNYVRAFAETNVAWYVHPELGAFNNFAGYYGTQVENTEFRELVHKSHYSGIQLHHQQGMSQEISNNGPIIVAKRGDLHINNTGNEHISEGDIVTVWNPMFFAKEDDYNDLLYSDYQGSTCAYVPSLVLPERNHDTHAIIMDAIDARATSTEAEVLKDINLDWPAVTARAVPLLTLAAICKRRIIKRIARKGAYICGTDSVCGFEEHNGVPSLNRDLVVFEQARSGNTTYAPGTYKTYAGDGGSSTEKARLTTLSTGFAPDQAGKDAGDPILLDNKDEGILTEYNGAAIADEDYIRLTKEDPVLVAYDQMYHHCLYRLLTSVTRLQATSESPPNGVFSVVPIC